MKQLITGKFKKWIQKTSLMLIVLMVMLQGVAISQVIPPPGSPGSGGGSVDSPLGGAAVPFDWKLNLLLLFAGIIFAVVIILRIQKSKMQKATV
jgi:hypothetical protein